jgi:hypothetical protein
VAKLIIDDSQPRDVRVAYVWWHIGIVGIGVGVVCVLLGWLIGMFVIDPLFCRAQVNIAACANSVSIAGNVGALLAATIGLGVLVRLRTYRPIVISAASASVMWGFAGWVSALSWIEVLAWTALCYGLSYVLFSWISRYSRTIAVLVAVVAIVIIARIVLAL